MRTATRGVIATKPFSAFVRGRKAGTTHGGPVIDRRAVVRTGQHNETRTSQCAQRRVTGENGNGVRHEGNNAQAENVRLRSTRTVTCPAMSALRQLPGEREEMCYRGMRAAAKAAVTTGCKRQVGQPQDIR